MPTTETRAQVAKGATETGAPLAKGATETNFFGKRRYRESNSDFFRLRRGVLSGWRLRRAGLFVNVGGSIT